jgi:hypothetical protein
MEALSLRSNVQRAVTPSSSSAKADDPVFHGASALSQAAAITGCRAFAGHDDRFMRVKTYFA